MVGGAAGLQHTGESQTDRMAEPERQTLSDALSARCLRRSGEVLGQRRCNCELTRGVS